MRGLAQEAEPAAHIGKGGRVPRRRSAPLRAVWRPRTAYGRGVSEGGVTRPDDGPGWRHVGPPARARPGSNRDSARRDMGGRGQ